jgi:hypothetical protein
VGAVVASGLPLVIIMITPSFMMSPLDKFLAVVLPIGGHVVNGYIVEPKIFGKSLVGTRCVLLWSPAHSLCINRKCILL